MTNEVIHTELLAETSLCGGKYIIEKKIGAGGFGITYLAKHATLEKKYAIKEFFLSGYNVRNNDTNHISLQGIEEKDFDKFRQRFIDEARTLASLNNDAVVKVIDIFDENGTSYMVMPFVEGITLQSMVDENGPMEYEMAVNYIVRICDALSYIHSKNILHRDVTPDNIIVTPEQKTVLIDFGSARKFVDNKTQRHTTILKQGYAPLEQYSATSRKGAYTDLYSLGGVFYYILTGVRPLDATDRAMEKMKEPVELNPKIPEQINAVIMKAMAMDIKERYQSADEMEKDILSGNMPKHGKSSLTDEKGNIMKAMAMDIKERYQSADEMGRDILSGNMPKRSKKPLTDEKGNDKKGEVRQKKNLLKMIATGMAIVAVLVFVISSRPQKMAGGEPEQPKTETVGQEMYNLDSLKQRDINELASLLNENSDNPAVLYATAFKVVKIWASEKDVKQEVEENPLLRDFWKNVLVSEGDSASYWRTDITSFSEVFAWVCAKRAESILSSCKDTLSMTDSLPTRLQELLDAF